MPQTLTRLAAMALLALAAAWGNAQTGDWGDVTIVSGTVGNNTNRLCMGVPDHMRPSDIGCPSYAPSLSTAGHVSITGNVSANKFIGDGSGLTNLNVQGDRIVSDTHAVIVDQNTGYVSLTTGGSTWGYFSAGWSYLANFFTNTVSSSLVSATNVSATYVDVTRNGTVSGTYGYFRYISGTDIHGRFTGDGSGLSGVIAGATDRIISGTNASTRMVAVSDTGYISITQAGANSGWFDPYRGLVSLGVSATGPVSATQGYIGGFGNTQRGLTIRSQNGANSHIPFSDGQVYLTGDRSAGATGTGDIILRSHNGTGNTTHVTVKGNTGNVGIGTISPTATLQVSGTFTVSMTGQTEPSLLVDGDGRVGVRANQARQAILTVGPHTVVAAPASSLMVKESSGAIGNAANSYVYPAELQYQTSGGNTARLLMSGYRRDAGTLWTGTGYRLQFGVDNSFTAGERAYIELGSTANGDGRIILGLHSADRLIITTNTIVASGTVSVTDAIQVGGSNLSCSSGIPGAIRYNSPNLQFCNGTSWTNIGGGGGGTVTGTGSATAVAVWNGTNALSYDTDGFYWDATHNRLGVGTNTPSVTLNLVANQLGAGTMRTMNLNTEGYAGITLANHANESVGVFTYGNANSFLFPNAIWIGTRSNTVPMVFTSNGADLEEMRLSNGRLGIGTPSATATLQVSGSFTVSTSVQSTTPSLFVGMNGRVGIGNGAPQVTVEANGRLRLLSTSDGGPTAGVGLEAFFSAGNDRGVLFAYDRDGGTPKDLGLGGSGNSLIVKATGSVGIGTLHPSASLHVNGTVSVTDAIQLGRNTIACASQVSGSIRYSIPSNTVQFCNGIGWVSLASGTTGGGALMGTGSATTVAYWNGANSLTYDTDGFYWDATNNRLGVGTNTPSVTLNLVANQAGLATIRAMNLHTQGYAGIALDNHNNESVGTFIFGNANAAYFPNSLWIGTRSNTVPIVFTANGSDVEDMRLSNGRLGIGTSSATATLQVSGTFIVSNSNQVSSPTFLVSGNRVGVMTANPWEMAHIGNEGVGGRLWIGEDNATRRGLLIAATVANEVSGSTYPPFVRMTAFNYGSNKSLPFVINPHGTEGFVSIGKFDPKAMLDVQGTISASSAIQVGPSSLLCASPISGSIRYNTTSDTLQVCTSSGWKSLVSGTTGGGGGGLTGTGSATAVAFWSGASSLGYDSGLHWDNINKRLGVGTVTPLRGLEVKQANDDVLSGIGVANAAANSRVSLWVKGNTAHLWSGGSGQTALVMNAGGGLVGIGTESPTAALQVSGSFIVSSTQTNLSPSIFVSTDGRVGLGTSNIPTPGSLYIVGANYGSYGPAITVADSGDTLRKNLKIGISTTATATGSGFIQYSQENVGHANLLLNPMGGNVGVGRDDAKARLDVAGTISATDAIQLGQNTIACGTMVSGSIRYNTTSNTVQFCSGTGWVSLASGTTGGGASALSGLTDVQLTNPAGRDYLRFDSVSGKWVNISESTAMSATTMVPNIPDAILCSTASEVIPYYLQTYSASGIEYARPADQASSTRHRITYTAEGAYSSHTSAAATDCVTNTWSLNQLYAAGKAFNFIGNSGAGDGSALGDGITSGTLAMVANSATSYVSLSTAGTTWGYFNSGLSYLPTIGTGRVSATNVSATLLQVGHNGAACTSGMAGGIRYNAGELQFCNGAAWSTVLTQGVSGTIAAFGSVLADGTCVRCSGATVTKGGNGAYTVDLAIVQPNTSYTVQLTGSTTNNNARSIVYHTLTTSNFGVMVRNADNTAVNTDWAFAVITQPDVSGGVGSGTELGDRITSGTLAMVANSATSFVSLSTAGTTWGYLNSAGSFLPSISGNKVSSTNVSATYLQLHSPTTVLGCNAGFTGAMRYTSGTMQVCDGSNWGNIGIGVPTGTISAFAASSCPSGWTEYTAARGRFLRGIDNGAGNDPDGTRGPGNSQGDAFQGHWHSGFSQAAGGNAANTTANTITASNAARYGAGDPLADGMNGTPRTANETRPKNVAVTFCMYSGFQSAPGQTILTTLASLTDVSIAGVTAGQILAFDGSSWVASNTIGGGTALGDRVTSETHAVAVNASSGYVSLSTSGTDWGYLSSGNSYLPTLVAGRVSTTNVSVSLVQLGTTSVACGTATEGALRYATGVLQVCNGLAWGSVTTASSTAYIHVRDWKASGTTGDTVNATTWTELTLNDVNANTITGASLSSNKITLPAGTYRAQFAVPIYAVGAGANNVYKYYRARLRDVGSGTVLVNSLSGMTGQRDSRTHALAAELTGYGTFTLAAPATVSLEFYTTNAVTIGAQVSLASYNENYTNLIIESLLAGSGGGGGAGALDDLTDVNTSGATPGSVIRYDGANWVVSTSGDSSALGDRITSGTLAVAVNTSSGYVSLSTSGTDWGYLSSGISYLPTLTAGRVSVTNVSATYIQLNSPSTVLACNAGFSGAMRYTSGTMQVCDGSNWGNIGIGVPTGTIAAFAASSCPSGWSEYAAARGRFLRGIDTLAGGLDPDGTRAAGNAQEDAFQGHRIRVYDFNAAQPRGGGGSVNVWNVNSGAFVESDGNFYSDGTNGTPRTANETRPKNVAVTFCMYSGFQSAPGQPILTTLASLTDVSIAGATTGQVLAFNGSAWVASNTMGGGTALGDRITSGSTSVIASQNASVTISTAGATRLIVGQSGFVGIGTITPSTPLEVSGSATAGAFLYSSDMRLKENIIPLSGGLSKLDSITPVTFSFTSDGSHTRRLGVIAQEVEKVYPQAVFTGEDGFKKVDYPALVPIVIDAVKELKAENRKLREEVKSLKAANVMLKAANDNFDARLDAVELKMAR